MGVCAESAETFRKKLSLTKGYYHKISFLSRYKLLKIFVPFLCNVTLHPISPMEHLAICKVFIDGEVRHGKSGSVYPILLLEH